MIIPDRAAIRQDNTKADKFFHKNIDKRIEVCYNFMALFNNASILTRTLRRANPKGGVFNMAKAIESYEIMAIYSLKNGEEAAAALVEKFKAMIEQNGTLEEVNEWGKRRLAYEIDDQTEGYYVLYHFTCAPDFPAELDRVFKITEGVMRSLITVNVPKTEYPPKTDEQKG